MKMLIITANFASATSGGEGERAVQLMRYAEKLECNVNVITYNWTENKTHLNLDIDKIIQVPYLSERFKFPKINFKLFKEILSNIHDSDIIHLMGYWNILYVLIYPLMRIKSKPYIICSAGSLKITGRSKFLKTLYNYIIGNNIIKNANRCITIVDDEIKGFLTKGAKLENIVNIPNGIEFHKSVIKNNLIAIDNFDLKAPYILFVGRLNLIKGADLLLDAFLLIVKKFPNLNIAFVGNDEGLQSQMEIVVKKNNLNTKVFFLGYKETIDKSALYKNASAVVIPSWSEAMSIVFLEAAVHKIPIIISNNCGLNHIEKLNLTKIVKANPEDIAKGISEVLNDKNWKKISSNKLYKYALDNYDWSKIIKEYLICFDSILNDKRL